MYACARAMGSPVRLNAQVAASPFGLGALLEVQALRWCQMCPLVNLTKPTTPVQGLHINGSLQAVIETDVLIEPQQAPSATVRWVTCLIASTQDHAVAKSDKDGTTAVIEWLGETLPEFRRCTTQMMTMPGCDDCNQIIDDGGDDTLTRHQDCEIEAKVTANGSLPDPNNATHLDAKCVLQLIVDPVQEAAHKYTRMAAAFNGMSEETTNGVHCVRSKASEGELPFSANANGSVTIPKFDNVYGCWHPPPSGLERTPYRDTPWFAISAMRPMRCVERRHGADHDAEWEATTHPEKQDELKAKFREETRKFSDLL